MHAPRVIPCRGGHDLRVGQCGDAVERLGLPRPHDDDVLVVAVHDCADESGFGEYPHVAFLLEVVLMLLRPHTMEM